MICPNCGNNLIGNEMFCNKCGNRIQQSSPTINQELQNQNTIQNVTDANITKKSNTKFPLIIIIIIVVIVLIYLMLTNIKNNDNSNEKEKSNISLCKTDTPNEPLVAGQYTYMNGFLYDGKYYWGVKLTDMETEKITDKICTYINDEPVKSMRNLFFNSKATIVDLSSFDTSNVTDMSGMFFGSAAINLDLSSFDTSNVTDMSGMFWQSAATNLDLSSFDTSNVTDMSNMFQRSAATSIDLSSFDTSNVTDMSGMFSSSIATILDLSSFDTSNVKNTTYMFTGSHVKTIYVRNAEEQTKIKKLTELYMNSDVDVIIK